MVQGGKTSDEGEVILGQVHIYPGMQKLLLIISTINYISLLCLIKVFLLTHPRWCMYFQLFVFSVVVTLSDQWQVFARWSDCMKVKPVPTT